MTDTQDALRVMQFLTVFECGGTERQALNLALALQARGSAVRFGCLRRAGRLLPELDARSIPVDEYPVRSLYSAHAWRQVWALSRALMRDQVDVMHAYNLYGNVFAVPAARLAGVPVVIAAVRDCGIYLNAWRRRIQREACRLANLILVNAEKVKAWLVGDGYSPDNIVVIRNGVDLSRFTTVGVGLGGPGLRRELSIPPDAPLISTIARLCPSKGFEDAIDAMAVVHARHPKARLLIVGEGLRSENGELTSDDTYRRQLEARVRALGLTGTVHFLGYRSDTAEILGEVSVAMQPSLTEGLSNSILEAMAARRAVVATPVGGTPEVIRHGISGWLTPVSDPRSLGEAVSQLLDDDGLRAALGGAARQLVEQELSVPAMTMATERVYRAALDQKRHRKGWRPRSPVTVADR